MVVLKGLISDIYLVWEGVMLLSGLILGHFVFGEYGGVQKTDFGYFLLREGVAVLKGLILDNLHFDLVLVCLGDYLEMADHLGGDGGRYCFGPLAQSSSHWYSYPQEMVLKW